MSSYKTAQIFASIPGSPSKVQTRTDLPTEETVKVKTPKTGPETGNNIHVTASSQLSLEPDRCRVTIFVSSKKEQVQDAKNSVARRIDYIIQTLYNNHIKESDITTSKVLKRVDGLCHLDAEVTAIFTDFHKCQSTCNLLVEKLDENVKVSNPEFFQSPHRLENLRRQASITAVSNSRQKALEIARFLHANIGRPVSIHEDSVCEWEGSNDINYDADTPLTMQQRIEQATVYVKVNCSASFELKAKGKNRDTNKC